MYTKCMAHVIMSSYKLFWYAKYISEIITILKDSGSKTVILKIVSALVCVCVCMYVYMCMYICVCICVYIYMCVCTVELLYMTL